jgi:hypothetical protein
MTDKDTLKSLNEMTDASAARASALAELNLRTAERVMSRQMDLMNLFVEQGARLMRLPTETRGYGELYRAQMDLSKEASERVMAESKANLQMASEARDEYRAWYEETLAAMRSPRDQAAAG